MFIVPLLGGVLSVVVPVAGCVLVFELESVLGLAALGVLELLSVLGEVPMLGDVVVLGGVALSDVLPVLGRLVSLGVVVCGPPGVLLPDGLLPVDCA